MCVKATFYASALIAQIIDNGPVVHHESPSSLYRLLAEGGKWEINQETVFPMETVMYGGFVVCVGHLSAVDRVMETIRRYGR